MSETDSDVPTKDPEDQGVALSDDLNILLSEVIDKHGFKNYTTEIRSLSARGEGFMGLLYQVTVTEIGGEKNKRKNFFVKCILPGVKTVLFPVREIFLREIFVYEELSKIYEELQAEANIPLEDRYEFVDCHGVCKTEGSVALILENMAAKGYETWNKENCISLEFAESCVKRLAVFHGLSYALRGRRPAYYESRVAPLTTLYLFDEDWTTFVRNTVASTIELFDSETRRDKLRQFVEDTLEKFPKYYSSGNGSVLCHGDYRPNNILFKTEEGSAPRVVPVDYQIAQVCSPLVDLVYILFTGTDSAFRRAHLPHLKTLYRESVRTFLRRFDIDLEAVYPSAEFESEYREKLDYGLMMGLVFLPYILVPAERAPDMATTPVTSVRIAVHSLFESRFTQIVEDFELWGYL